MDRRLEGRQGPGLLKLSSKPGAWPAACGRAAAAVYLRIPFHILDFHLPSGPGPGSDPPSLRNVGPRPGPARPGAYLLPRSPEPRCLHLTLRPDPVSKSPESHFLPRPPRPSLLSPPLPSP